MTQFLPVGIQDFEVMITGNFVYVDKTRYIYQMVKPPQGFYFLARPRRFGKSLTVSTLDYLFQGRKELFEHLDIADTDWEWKSHPVIKIDFNQISSEDPDSLKESLLHYIFERSEKHHIQQTISSLPNAFARLITQIAEKAGEPVAVLIDEYDKPIVNHLGSGKKSLDTAKKNRNILKQLFGVLKSGGVSAALRFVFITGISKFARVSIFSDLNNLNDLSMHHGYAHLAGYTSEELRGSFKICIEALSKEKNTAPDVLVETIRGWYNGYKFTADSEPVYNPFSIVRLFESGEFKNYWFETATPTFLINLIREKGYPVTALENLNLPEESFTVYDIEHLQLEPLLFQTGYLTIDRFEEDVFFMKYPNREVRISFLSYLLNDFVGPENTRVTAVYKLLHRHLKEMKMDDFIEGVRSVLASIPYSLITGKKDEAYYHTVFYLMLSASGLAARPEVLSSRGRMDMAVEFEEKVFIIELKCNQNSDMAIRQVLEKGYYEKYLQTGREIYLMGINFDTEKRTIEDWQCKSMEECEP